MEHSENLKAILTVKKALKEVKVELVVEKLGLKTRQGIYYHLNENKADTVSLPHLQKIAQAIEEVKQANSLIAKTIIDAKD